MTAVQIAAQDISARELVQSAYENRYTWDKNFPGYTTDVTLKMGDKTVQGKAKVNPDLSAEVFDVDDDEANKIIKNQLWEVAIHRVSRPFEKSHGDNTFTIEATEEDGAVKIAVGGKAAGDAYKVKDNEFTMVHRHIHGVVVTINTFSSYDTGSGYLSHTYDSVYHDPKTGELKQGRSEFTDDYTQVGDYTILQKRTVTSADGPTMEISFSNIELL
ncbi:MAG: Protein of unknown function (DUF3386) [Phormidesmis priestleyi Ana]|uniref:DUF3386 domain-containing protein n=1 Tax=Phormidesmis priestleyi Ana TaxID=1666911 RepID=A0A0P7ZKE9_9CYAN|nr:MAG: Protein of unknown function (DUF3386) [Phormidesmis priestleyi Ana]